MEYSYKFRIYPNQEQIIQIHKTFGCVRFIYNHYLGERIKLYQENKTSLNYHACSKAMTALKKELAWLYEVDSTALQASLKDLDFAYQNFFRNIQKGAKKAGFPRFKCKRDYRKSFKTRSAIKVFEDCIKLPKMGYVSAKISKQVKGRILSATVSQNPSGKYFVALCCTEVELEAFPVTHQQVGIDLGLKDYAITSDGQKFENHKHLAKDKKKLVKRQRQLSRKQKGSRNRNKARIEVAKLHERIANRRNDALHKLSSYLIQNYDFLALEDLQVKNLLQNHKLAGAIADASWSEFVRQLEYKASYHQRIVVKIDKFYPSSQLCSCCGYKNPQVKDLTIRNWICPNCQAEHDRDRNAALNILNEGLRVLAS